MILSHRHRFVFLAVPRTGSQSVRAALRPYLDPGDEEQAAWRTRRRLRTPALAALEHGHITATEAASHLPPAIWEEFFTFTFVRNPWDRFLSAAMLHFNDSTLFRKRPIECLDLLLQSDTLMTRLHFRSQVEFVLNARGELGVNEVGRLESLETDFARIAGRIGLPDIRLEHHHASSPMDRHAWRTTRLVRRVVERYREDYETFGYPIPQDA